MHSKSTGFAENCYFHCALYWYMRTTVSCEGTEESPQFAHGREHTAHRTYDAFCTVGALANVAQEEGGVRRRSFSEMSPLLDKRRREISPVVANFVGSRPIHADRQIGRLGERGCMLFEEGQGLLGSEPSANVVRRHLIEQRSQEWSRCRQNLHAQSYQSPSYP
jgi:hypothetical protein